MTSLDAARPVAWLRNKALRAIDRVPDYCLGIDTSRVVPSEDLEFAPTRGNWYVAAGWTYLNKILQRAELDPGGTFVDFGCGKGRVVMLAARHSFDRVVGIELDGGLATAARANLDKVGGLLRCKNVEIIHGDVVEVPIPSDMTFAFLFNPFGARIFERFAENLAASLTEHPRRVDLAYLRPVHEGHLLARGFREQSRLWAALPQAPLVHYRYEPGAT